MNNTYPIGTPLTFVWRFQAPDGSPIVFTARNSFALKYITGRGTTTIDTFFVSPDMDGLTWTLPADQQRFVGNYGLVVDILLDGELLEHCYYNDAFSLYKTDAGTMYLSQNNRGETIDLLSVGEFYHFMTGEIINAPDEEDLTSGSNNLLKFKDRTPVSGMGYVILRKNKSFASQLTQENTIYEVRYDFDLGEASVTIPSGCVLKFNGGKLKNGSISFVNTYIDADNLVVFQGCTLSGAIKNDYFNVAWCGIVPNDSTIDSSQLLLNVIGLTGTTLLFGEGTFYLSETYIERDDVSIKGESSYLVSRTVFSPYEGSQRYLLKFGGGADSFGGSDSSHRVKRISVCGIMFYGIQSKPLANNDSDSGTNFECGYIIFDTVERGNLSVSGWELWGAPLVSFGYSYEIHSEYLCVYGNHCKSNCAAINFFSKSLEKPISAFTIEEIKCECLCGPIIYAGENAVTDQLIINNVNIEGSQVWERHYLEDVTSYTVDDDFSNFDSYNHVPLFSLFSGSVIVNNLVLDSVYYRWKNTADSDTDTYCVNTLSKLVGGAPKITVNNVKASSTSVPVWAVEGNNNSSYYSTANVTFAANSSGLRRIYGSCLRATFVNFIDNNVPLEYDAIHCLSREEMCDLYCRRVGTAGAVRMNDDPFYVSFPSSMISAVSYYTYHPFLVRASCVLQMDFSIGITGSMSFALTTIKSGGNTDTTYTVSVTADTKATLTIPLEYDDAILGYHIKPVTTPGYSLKIHGMQFVKELRGAYDKKPSSGFVGLRYYDTTNNQPIYWTGSAWVDATGDSV